MNGRLYGVPVVCRTLALLCIVSQASWAQGFQQSEVAHPASSVYATTDDPGAMFGPVWHSTVWLNAPQTQSAADSTDPDADLLQPPLPFIVPYQTRGTVTWLAGGGDTLGMTDLEISETFAFPYLKGLTIKPAFGLHLLDGPARTDLPPRLYDVSLELGWAQQLTERFGYQLAVAPGVYSDFDNDHEDSFLITGRAIGVYGLTPTTKASFGVIYLDRQNVRILPAFGVIWEPNDATRWELVFPQPRISWRLPQRYTRREQWVYLSGEFGSGQWGIERASGADDLVTYTDWRLIVGYKSEPTRGPTLFLEAGYVFQRELEYESSLGDFDPDNTLLLRAGFEF